jgi:hypothetical protein
LNCDQDVDGHGDLDEVRDALTSVLVGRGREVYGKASVYRRAKRIEERLGEATHPCPRTLDEAATEVDPRSQHCSENVVRVLSLASIRA